MTRITQLDAIRGIAVTLVVFHHWTATGRALDFGNLGVQLFFVLSGCLITGILLDVRTAREADGRSLGQVLAGFWQSRAARIWPVCFLTLFAVLLAGERFERRADMGWHFAFASNILFFIRGEYASSLAHFWTLAVEQQFYLIWPLVVLLCRRSWLEPITITCVLMAPLFRLGMYFAGFRDFTQFNLLPFASMDSLGLGALIAIWMRLPAEDLAKRRSLLGYLAVVAAAAFAANVSLGPLPANMSQTFYGVVFAWIVFRALEGIPGITGRILGSRPLVALGVVSYAVYVYHMFAPRLVGAILRALDAPAFLHDGVALFILSAIATLTAATISWVFLERPINRARRRWQQRKLGIATMREPGELETVRP